MITDNNTDSNEQTWHKVTKFYKGGRSMFQIAVPKGVRLSKDDWETILEWLGENTNGGHSYGYSMNTRRLRRKSSSLPVRRYPSGLCAQLMNFGEVVTTQRRMI